MYLDWSVVYVQCLCYEVGCTHTQCSPIHSCPSLLLGLCPSSVWASGRLFILCLRGHSFCHSDLSLSSISCLLPGGKGLSACSSSPWAVLRSAQCLVWVTSTPLFFYHWHGFFCHLLKLDTVHCVTLQIKEKSYCSLLRRWGLSGFGAEGKDLDCVRDMEAEFTPPLSISMS